MPRLEYYSNDGKNAVHVSAPCMAAVSWARTADTNAYAAGDVIGTDNAGSAAAAALTFSGINVPEGGDVVITRATLRIDKTAIISGETTYKLALYNVTPPSAYVDNNAWDLPSGDRASFMGFVDLGTPVDVGSTVYVEQFPIGKQISTLSDTIYAYLITNGAYTPASGTNYRVSLHFAPA